MTTQEFFNTLKEHPDKSLLFQYMPGQLVGANYHITEVKHITVDLSLIHISEPTRLV